MARRQRGWNAVSREDAILAIVAAPIEGSAHDRWARKIAALKAELVQLSAAESRTLATRLTRQHADDPIATALAANVRMGDAYRTFEVRGAASRYAFVPKEEFRRMGKSGKRALEQIKAASSDDAHAKSGNFDAGLGPTTTQTSQQHVERQKELPR
jgi:hypothetical protein